MRKNWTIRNYLKNPITYLFFCYIVFLIINLFYWYEDTLIYALGFPYFSNLFLENTPFEKPIFYLIALLHIGLFIVAIKLKRKWLDILTFISVVINIFAGFIMIQGIKGIAEALAKEWVGQ